jgi:hypothetical protein
MFDGKYSPIQTSASGYKRTLLGTVIYFRFTPESGHPRIQPATELASA